MTCAWHDLLGCERHVAAVIRLVVWRVLERGRAEVVVVVVVWKAGGGASARSWGQSV